MVAFDRTIGYTPSLVRLSHSLVERLVYIVDSVMIPMCPWCPPPGGVRRVAALAYSICIILYGFYLGSPLILGIILTVNLAKILLILCILCVIVLVLIHALWRILNLNMY